MGLEKRAGRRGVESKVLDQLPRSADGTITDVGLGRVLAYHDLSVEVAQILSRSQPSIRVGAPGNKRAGVVVFSGDEHIGSEASSPLKLKEIADWVAEKRGAVMVNLSNSMEAAKYPGIIAALNLTPVEQIELVRKILSPLDRKKKLIMVTGNKCHEGSVGEVMMEMIRYAVGERTQLLDTGGTVIIADPDNPDGPPLFQFIAAHNTGRGGADGAANNQLRALGVSDRPDVRQISGFAHGHYHIGPRVGQGITLDRIPTTGADGKKKRRQRTQFTIVPGSPKGQSGSEGKRRQDSFLQQMGTAAIAQPGETPEHGAGLVYWFSKPSGEYVQYPVAGMHPTDTLYNAVLAWEMANQTGTLTERTQELADKARRKGVSLSSDQDIAAEPNLESSLTTITDSNQGPTAPVFDYIEYSILTGQPHALFFLGNLRLGSARCDEDRFGEHLRSIQNRANTSWFAMRGLLDEQVPTNPDRLNYVLRLAGLLGIAGTKLNGIMLNDALVDPRFQKDITFRDPTNTADRITVEGIYPGDMLVTTQVNSHPNPLTDVPLLASETTAVMRFPSGVSYSIFARGESAHFKSALNPTRGLKRNAEIVGANSDILAGGTPTEVVSWETGYSPLRDNPTHVVTIGGYSLFKKGSNKFPWAEGGQGIVLMPNEKIGFPFANFADGMDIHQALTFLDLIVKVHGEKGVQTYMRRMEKNK